MIDVYLTGPEQETARVAVLGNKLQTRFRFSTEPAPATATVRMQQSQSDLLRVSREEGVLLSLDQSDDISQYARIPRTLYILSCVTLGLVYWRVLALNPLLVWEDLLVREDPDCLCTARATLQEYALAFERPWVCPACLEFFRCLGVEPETAVLQEMLSHLVRAQKQAMAKSS